MRVSKENLCDLKDFWKNYENITRNPGIFKLLLNLRNLIEISKKF